MATRLLVFLLLIFSACTPPPKHPEACGPITPPTPVCGAPPEWIGLSERVWDAYEDCSNENAIRVDIVDYIRPKILGHAYQEENRVEVKKDAYPPQVVLAHEIGHILGYNHRGRRKGPHKCRLMFPKVCPSTCGSVQIRGCNYRIQDPQ